MKLGKLKQFNGKEVSFVETIQIKEGVVCDVYSFINDDSKDLGIVTLSKGYKTPLQRVLLGDKTIEGFMGGTGILTIQKEGEDTQNYKFPDTAQPKEIDVKVGELMQWEAGTNENLEFYEICYPPYKDGRYENL